jgi:predicted transcriptional regulator
MKKKNRKPRSKQLSRQEYDKLKRSAYEYVVVQGMDQKEVALLLKITEATLSKWANGGEEGKWKDLREARQQCLSSDSDNVKKLLRVMSQQRLELEEQILDAQKVGDTKEEVRLRKEARALSDEMSKQNKTLLTLDKSKYTLGVFIDVMDEIFNALRQHDEELWEKTIEFQSTIIRRKTNELG